MSIPLRRVVLDLVILSLLAVSVLVPFVGSGSLQDWDEAIYAEVARQYLETGELLKPSWNGAPWYHKPPLAMWLTAAAYTLWGVNEATARLLAVICGIAGILLTYIIGSDTLGRREGLVGALVLLSTPHYFVFSRMGMLDIPLTFFLALSLYSFWRGVTRPRWLLAAGLAFGVAFMIKGPASLVVPLAVATYLTIHRDFRILRSVWLWGGVIGALAIICPWHLYQYLEHGRAFWEEYLLYHIVLRARTAIEGHEGGALFYVQALVKRQRPWFLMSLPAIPFCIWISRRERVRCLMFLLCWIAAVVVSLMMVKTRIQWYLIPVYPALSLVTGFFLVRIVPSRHYRWIVCTCLAVLAIHGATSRHLFSPDYSASAKALGPHIQAAIPRDRPLYLYGVDGPAALFYGRRRVISLDAEMLDSIRRNPKRVKGNDFVVLSSDDAPEHQFRFFDVETIATAGDCRLLRLHRDGETVPGRSRRCAPRSPQME